MSGSGISGIKGHDDTVNSAESVRQGLVTSTTAQATVNSAEITYFRAVAKSALKNGVSTAASMSALRNLGVTGI